MNQNPTASLWRQLRLVLPGLGPAGGPARQRQQRGRRATSPPRHPAANAASGRKQQLPASGELFPPNPSTAQTRKNEDGLAALAGASPYRILLGRKGGLRDGEGDGAELRGQQIREKKQGTDCPKEWMSQRTHQMCVWRIVGVNHFHDRVENILHTRVFTLSCFVY